MSRSRPLPLPVAAAVHGHPGVRIDVSLLPDDTHLSIHLVRTDPELTGRGLADAALRDLLAACDDHELVASLTPEPLTDDHRTSKARLVRWYTRHGFVPNRGRTRDFETRDTYVRTPR